MLLKKRRSLMKKAKDCIIGLYKSIDKMKLFKNAINLGIGSFFTGGTKIIADFTISVLIDKIMSSNDEILKENLFETINAELTNKELRESIITFRKRF